MLLWQLIDMLARMDPQDLTAAELTTRLSGVRFDKADLAPYLSWQQGGYTRNGVFRCAAFEVILMAWDAGAKSPVHGHAGQTCWLSVHQGRLSIESYAYAQPENAGRTGDGIGLELHDTAQLGPGDIELDIAGLDVHRVLNMDEPGKRAVSVHIYARPFDSCIAYDVVQQTARVRQLRYDKRAQTAPLPA